MPIRYGPSGQLKDLAAGDIAPGASGQQLFTNPAGNASVWASPLGHSEDLTILAGTRETDQVVETGQSVVTLDPSQLVAPTGGLTRTIRLESSVWASVGMQAEVSLYNLTDGAAVAGTIATTASTVPVLLQSADLSAALPDGPHEYELRLRISAGVPGPLDRAYLGWSRLIINWS